MSTPDNSPRDLARLVYASLRDVRQPPSIEVLEELFQVLFLSSLEREEGTSPRCTVAFASPKRPDPTPPSLIRPDRWTYSPFASRVPVTVANLTKLAIASDPDLSAFAVYPNTRGDLEISGMFDQQAGFRALMRDESTGGGYDPPGLFQAEIRDLGYIVVTQGAKTLGELNRGQLVSESQEVFRAGPVRRAFAGSIERFRKSVRTVAAGAGYPVDNDPESDVYIAEQWVQTLRRLLLRARAHGHGGAFLFSATRSQKHLRVKHGLRYDRLGRLLALAVGHSYVKQNVYELVHDEYMETGSDSIPVDLYLDETIADGDNEDADNALSSAIGSVAALSRLDGLVLMDTDLRVRGFGVEITAPEIDLDVLTVSIGHGTRGKKVPLERFGTRHRSMFRYCAAHPGSVGFVLSADGPVRAVLLYRNRILVWENIRLTSSGIP